MSAAISRRQTLIGIGVASAAAALPVAGSAQAANKVDRAAWDAALARYRLVDAEYDRLCNVEDTADGLVHDACPRVDCYFDEYRLGMGMKWPAVVESIAIALRRQEGGGGIPYPVAAREAYRARAAEIEAEAERIADEFMAYQQRIAEAKKRYGVEQAEAAARAYRSRFYEARDAVMSVPAPDTAALLVKLELAAISLDDEHAESALADARRLLSNGRG